MKLECKIAPGITTNLLKKLNIKTQNSNELSANQLVDFITEHLHDFRNRKLKEVQDSIDKYYPIDEWNEHKFVECVIKNHNNCSELLYTKLRKYFAAGERGAMVVVQVFKEIMVVQQGQNDAEFIEHVMDIAFGSKSDWIQQQKKIRKTYTKNITKLDIYVLQRITSYNYPRTQYQQMKQKIFNDKNNGSGVNVFNSIISELECFRNKTREMIRNEYLKSTVTNVGTVLALWR
eukprot:264232_1